MTRGDKFKVGDRVVKTRDDGECSFFPIGSKATITGVDGDGMPWCKYDGIVYREFSNDCIGDRFFELEEVATSPLYKALA